MLYYLFLVSMLSSNINTGLGLDFGEFRISISDILCFICVVDIIRRNKLKITSQMKNIFLVALLFLLWCPFGIVNGAPLTQCFRVVRNWILALATFVVIFDRFSSCTKNRLRWEVLLISIIVIFDNLYNSITLYFINNWFKNYRVNSCLLMALFVFIWFSKEFDTVLWRIVKYGLLILLFICSLLSQERTQIVIEAGVVAIIALSTALSGLKRMSFKIPRRQFIGFFIGCSVLLVVGFVSINIVKENEFLMNYLEYYEKYRVGLVFSKDSGFSSDTSLTLRYSQIINLTVKRIFSSDFLYFLVGSGTCSIYFSGAVNTFIVDGMIPWTLKDLGVIGLLILLKIYVKGFSQIKVIKDNKPYLAMAIATIFATCVKPAVMYDVFDAFAFGFVWALISSKYSQEMNEQRLVMK